MEKNRTYLFDNIKFLLIIAVAVGHFANVNMGSSAMLSSVACFVYSFHVQTFLFISGVFHKNQKIRSRCIYLLVLAFIFKCMNSLVYKALMDTWIFSLLKENGVPWFLIVLAMCMTFSYLFRDVNKIFLFFLFIVLSCLIGYDTSLDTDFLCLYRFVNLYPFYILGHALSSETMLKCHDKFILKLPALGIIIGWIALCIKYYKKVLPLCRLFSGRNNYDSYDSFATWGIPYRILCFLITFAIIFSLVLLVPKRKLPGISSAGSRTMPVYFFHYIILFVFERYGVQDILMSQFGKSPGVLIWLLLALLVVILLSLPVVSIPFEAVRKLCNKN